MTSYMYVRRPWHRRVLSRLHRAPRNIWSKFICQPYKALTRTLIRWLYGLRRPLIASNHSSAMKLAEPAPLPLIRKRRLSITSSDSPKVPTISPRFHGKIIKTRNPKQHTATQDKCPLFTKLPLELRLLIYRFVLGDLTLHIIPSHVPSLTLPPRFTLRTDLFCRRLDFEVCKSTHWHKDVNKDEVVVFKDTQFKDSEICTREESKLDEIVFLSQFHGKKETKDNINWVTSMDYFLTKHGRKGGPLALLKTCQVVYSEAIEILYTTNTFSFSKPETLILFPSTLLPTRVPLLRHLAFYYYFGPRDIEYDWQKCCAILRTLPCLQTLTITLSSYHLQHYIDQENESILSPLVNVNVEREFVVYLDWSGTDKEREVAEGARFRVVRPENMVVDEEEKAKRTRDPHIFGYPHHQSWTMRDDGPSDPDGV